MKGRKSTPVALKKLRGTDQPCRINDNQPVYDKVTKLPPAPAWMTKTAKGIYKTKGKELIAIGIIEIVDLDMFLSYCIEYGRYIDVSKELAGIPLMSVLDAHSEIVYRKLVSERNASWEKAKAIASQFGFTPSSRSSLKLPEKEKQDEFDKFLGL